MKVQQVVLAALVVGFIGGLGGSPVQANPTHSSTGKAIKSARDAYDAAWRLWSQGEGVKAEALLRQQTDQFPADARLALFLATSLASHSTDADSDTYFSRVVELGAKAQKPELASLAAQHFLHLSDPDTANEAFVGLTELARTQGNDPVFLWLYAQAAEKMEKPEVAEQAFKNLLKKAKNAPAVVRQGYADALEAQGKHFFALEHRLKAAQRESTPWSLHALSNNLRTLARFREAAQVAQHAVERFPAAPQGWHDLGVASVAMHRDDLALAHLSRAAQLAETSSEGFDQGANLRAWATCLESQKQFGAAAEKYRQLASLKGVTAEQARTANLRARAAELAGVGNN